GDRLSHRPEPRRPPARRQPSRRRHDDHRRAAVRRGAGRGAAGSRHRGARLSSQLLLVDDEASILDFLALLFTGEGYQVDTARSTAEAQRRLADKSYDLVLCDVLMPDGNGLDLLKEIRSASASTAVVMMTAYTSTKAA